ncbi:glycoside hydrolase superfamily [Limtongia smithiae]|uniref:glycoside hydrolase superfamily n=1 Tax=Limtongia smithiae TaxID=1125753 RepID=UPI0034CD545A
MPSFAAKEPTRSWWKESNVYQIYPSSFKDTNGDGIGDIQGIISELDHIKGLGADIIWICPCYRSPQVDMGYDISDYRDIDPRYGTLADIDELIEKLHERGMKLLMDLVVNHTSDQHMWFQSALTSKDSPYRDYYVWKKPKTGPNGERLPPNNWMSEFSGSVWEYDAASDEYYLHLFAVEQPDLNWENPKVVEEVHSIVRYWLDKGVDGFRLDAINYISKDTTYPDVAATDSDQLYYDGKQFYSNGPRMHEFLQGIGKILKSYNAFSVGEMGAFKDPKDVLDVVAESRVELNMVFQFEIVDIDCGTSGRYFPQNWNLPQLKQIVTKWQTSMYENDGWNALFLENHDQGRSVSRFGSDLPEFRSISAKMLATFLGLQSGTVFVYQGQELGMANIPTTWDISQFRDLWVFNVYNELVKAQDLTTLKVFKTELHKKGRDNSRTPVQWNSSDYAGFSAVQPWISVIDDYTTVNAAAQYEDPKSVYNYWSSVFKLRKSHKDLFVYGAFSLIDPTNEEIFAYERTYREQRALVVLSFSAKSVSWSLPKHYDIGEKSDVLLANYDDCSPLVSKIEIRPFEAIVYKLD